MTEMHVYNKLYNIGSACQEQHENESLAMNSTQSANELFSKSSVMPKNQDDVYVNYNKCSRHFTTT